MNFYNFSDIENNIPEKKKKKLLIIILTIIILIILLILTVIYILKSKHNKNKDSIIFKLTNWEAISQEKLNKSIKELSSEEYSSYFIKAPINWTTATAMGILYGDSNSILFDNNLKNVNKTQFDCPWFFRTKFKINNISNYEIILLHINGINYKGDLYIDSKKVNKELLIGTFIKFEFDIKEFLDIKKEEHYLIFKLTRPHNDWKNKTKDEIDLAISFVDWNPEAPDSNLGVWQPCEIELIEKRDILIYDFFVNTKLNDNNNEANLNINFYAKNYFNHKTKTNFNIILGNYFNFQTEFFSFEPNEEKLISLKSEKYSNLKIKNPELWYPHNMGEPKLHNLTIKSLLNNYTKTQEIGLREIKVIKNKLQNNTIIRNYKINNKNLLIKGGGWTPDLFLRENPNHYLTQIKYIKHMNLNSIRLEGKFEHNEFYSYCDKYGILIISGFNCADAWQRWDLWDDFTINLSNKIIKSLIKKLNKHPCVLTFILGSDFPPLKDIEITWREIFKNENWENDILSSATNKNETGVKMSGPYSWVPPNYFLCDTEKKYGGAWGFLTEGGPGENPLRYGSINLVFNKSDLIKIPYNNSVWEYHCGNSNNFNNLNKFFKPLNLRYGNLINFDDFLKKSAASVFENHKSMFESFNIKKYESSGIIHWMLNNAWPSNIWHLYDYFLTPTPSYFAVKKANQQLNLVYNYFDFGIYLVNNFYIVFNGNFSVKIEVFYQNGFDVYSNKSFPIGNIIEEDTVFKIDDLKCDLEYFFLNLVLFNQNEIISKNIYWLSKNMDEMNYTKSTFYNVEVTKYANLTFLNDLNIVKINTKIISFNSKNDEREIKILFENNNNCVAFLIELRLIKENNNENVVPVFYSDNYFSLFKNENIEITINYNIKDANNKNTRIEVRGWNINTFIITIS